VITKALLSAVIAVGVGVLVAAPASAGPAQCTPTAMVWWLAGPVSPFCGLSQSAPAGPAAPNQIPQGIQGGLPATQGQP
jgi:hypothetical protein